MEYKVVPFVASIGNKETSKQAANQLEDLIQNYASQGWKYIRLESLITFVQPESGCFGFGGKPGYTTSRQVIIFIK